MMYRVPDRSLTRKVKAAPRQTASGTTSPHFITRHVNFLSPEPRPVTTAFDHDGPGTKSPHGPRHDNDHVSIKDIQILPTTDEILSTDRPYMPKKNLNEPHFLVNGPMRHFDILFRHFRYDSTETIRDICYRASQNLASAPNEIIMPPEPRQETPAGNQYFEYQGVRMEEINAEEKKGMIIRLSYDCPEFMRGNFMHNCGRFQEGMLCALVCLDDSSELSIIFMEIHQRQSTTSMDTLGGLGKRAAVELSFPASAPFNDVLRVAQQAQGLAFPKLILVEFPKLLYAGFYWTLRRLQEMQPYHVAFLNYIAPSLNGPAVLDNVAATKAGARKIINCEPPLYAQAPGFAFELEPISSKPTLYNFSQLQNKPDAFTAFLGQNTCLDDGQAAAFHQNLTREFAFTQGPPGTGKTFLGIALVRTLLASRTGRPHKPLLIVCRTNHALDSFLSGLRDAGVKKLVRIGSKSREEWTKAISLREMSKKLKLPKRQFEEKYDTLRHKQALHTIMDSWCKGLNAERATQNISWYAVEKYLEKRYPQVHRQFVSAANNKHTEAFTFDYWAVGGDLQNLRDLRMELSLRLLDAAPKRSSPIGRTPDVDKVLAGLVSEAQRRSEAAGENSLWKMPLEERKILLGSWSRIVDREELAEQLASMHFDYNQAYDTLRGFWDEKDAATLLEADVIGMTTTASATRWSLLKILDLETLICEEAGEILEAHSLCSLLPTLEHAVFIGDPLQLRPEVVEQSMSLETSVGRDYRLDESMFERFMMPVDPAADIMPTSQLNVQRRMHPDIANITRLTYSTLLDHESTTTHPSVSGIARRMFWLDHQVLELDPSPESKSHVNQYEVKMVSGLVRYLLTRNVYSMGDIAVLTPYNGQLAALVEALQTTCAVWLNHKDREALLDDGVLPVEAEKENGHKDSITMAELLRIATVDNFQGEEAKVIILSTVRSGGRPGFLATVNRVNVACSRARDGFYVVGNSQTLRQVPFWQQVVESFAREGNIGPVLRLCCDRHPSHRPDICRPSDFAMLRECQIPCTSILGCGHQCFESCHNAANHDRIPCTKPCKQILECGHKCCRKCFEKCGSCTYRVGEQMLSCGHHVDALCSGSVPNCMVLLRKEILSCGHESEVRCFEENEPSSCSQVCGRLLACGHECCGACKDCKEKHSPCSMLCDRQLTCSHRCQSICHGEDACPSCEQQCLEHCSHGFCKNLCRKVCDPCVKPYVGRLDLALPGGPHTPELGEPQTLPLSGVPPKFSLSGGPHTLICSLGSILDQPAKFEGVFDRLIAKMGRRLDWFAHTITKHEKELTHDLESFVRSIRPNPLAAKFNKNLLTSRGSELRSLLSELSNFREHIVDPIEYSMKQLQGEKYTLLFHVRSDILEYRSRAVLALDTLKVSHLLMALEDRSCEVQRQAGVLQSVALQECFNCAECCRASIARCHLASSSSAHNSSGSFPSIQDPPAYSPCVQVELLLQETQFRYMAGDTSPSLLEKANLLCKQYPYTAGGFLETVESFYQYNDTRNPANIPTVTNIRSAERDWGRHAVGHLTTCDQKHPYSTVTFPGGCSECGKKVELENEVFGRTQAFLQENEFLRAMNIK